jgi:hypothetical protein
VESPVRAIRRAERVTGALAIALTLLSVGGVATAGSSFLSAPNVAAGWTGQADPSAAPIVPLAHGHSHNDYDQRVPLSDAIQRGFTSVEVDVWRIGRRLLIGHEILDAAALDQTLGAHYLDPLQTWVDSHGGSVFGDGRTPFTLVVDVKSAARTTYRLLDSVLESYGSMLTRFTADGVEPGAVTVVVSGREARAAMAEQPVRWAAYDGRFSDLAANADAPVSLMPLVSVKWTEHFRWDGTGEMPTAERAELRAMVTAAHEQGRRVRIYDTPARNAAVREAVWREQTDAQVDLLNVDDLAGAQRFLLAQGDPSLPYATAERE